MNASMIFSIVAFFAVAVQFTVAGPCGAPLIAPVGCGVGLGAGVGVPQSVAVVKKKGSAILGNTVQNCVGDINRIRLSPCPCFEHYDCITQAFGCPSPSIPICGY